MNKWYGFIGSDKYSIVIEFANFLFLLDKKVLVIDLSETHNIILSLPNPEKLSTFEFKGVTFSSDKDKLDSAAKYDYVLIDLGLPKETDISLLSRCENMVIVTDQQTHHLLPLQDFVTKYSSSVDASGVVKQKTNIAIVDYMANKLSAKKLCKYLGVKDGSEHVFTLLYDDVEYGSRLLGQHTHKFAFSRSEDTKELFLSLLGEPEGVNGRQIKRAIKKAGRGV